MVHLLTRCTALGVSSTARASLYLTLVLYHKPACGATLITICPTSLVRFTPGERVHLRPTPIQLCLLHFGLFLGCLTLFFGDGLGYFELFNRESGIKCLFVIAGKIKQARSAIRANHKGHHRVTIGVFIVWRFGEAEQFFLCLLDAFHVFVMIDLAIGI